MRNSETGEFELLVGNRQLLSGFFIVVLLFAVAFSMGYIVGRNSSPSAKLQTETGSSAGAASQTPESRPQAATQAPAAGGAPDAASLQSADIPPADTAPQPSTQPERGPQPGTPPAAPTVAANPPAAPPVETVPGSYWQVLATASQTSADVMRQTMKDKGFPASLQPGPNNLIRVLIGPYTDKQSLGRAKTELENAGVHPVLMK
ncbi:MAG: SPOR domain-containing protein [Bryobacteraceae bacterium]